MKHLHVPKYPKGRESWCYGILRSRRVCSMAGATVLGLLASRAVQQSGNGTKGYSSHLEALNPIGFRVQGLGFWVNPKP